MTQVSNSNAMSKAGTTMDDMSAALKSASNDVTAAIAVASAMQQLSHDDAAVTNGSIEKSTAPSSVEPAASDISQNNRDTSNTDMANNKEKTPMCLINELARYNKIQHQYRLTDEDGPAHQKTFTVLLRLGDEEYRASGPSIKRAQQSAAANALEKTNYKQRPPKHGSGRPLYRIGVSLTPTVELNALAMKRGEAAVYSVLDQSRGNNIYPSPNFNFRGAYNQRYHYQRYPRPCYVSLRVGTRVFVGEGSTVQFARHNAADQALRALRELPTPSFDYSEKKGSDNEDVIENSVDGGTLDTSTAVADAVTSPTSNFAVAGTENKINDNDELKSPISLVHEIALKRNLRVDFEVTRESGPPHLRTFITKCIVGNMITEGEGHAKKLSKKRAAERMLEELKKLPALPPSPAAFRIKKKKCPMKKKSRNLIKEQKANPEYGQGINPISRLIQIQQAKREMEPIYSLVAEGGFPRHREFVMRVQVNSHACNGTGANKKLAKRAAAEALLQVLGYSKPATSTDPPSPAITSGKLTNGADGDNEKARKVTFLEGDIGSGVIGDKGDGEGRIGRQLVPGLLLMPEMIRANNSLANINSSNHSTSGQSAGGGRVSGNPVSIQDSTMAAIAKELLISGSSPTAETISKTAHNEIGDCCRSPKQQLSYLADVLCLTVQFTDFPRGNKREFLSLVSLSTNPPQVSHGAGDTLEASHDQAALSALRSLADLGIDSLGSYVKKEITTNGEGHRVSTAQNGTLKMVESTGVMGEELTSNIC